MAEAKTLPLNVEQGTLYSPTPYWNGALINMVVTSKEEVCSIPNFEALKDDINFVLEENNPILGVWHYSTKRVGFDRDEKGGQISKKTFLVATYQSLFRVVITSPDREEDVNEVIPRDVEIKEVGSKFFKTTPILKQKLYTEPLEKVLFVQNSKGEVILIHPYAEDIVYYCKDFDVDTVDVQPLKTIGGWNEVDEGDTSSRYLTHQIQNTRLVVNFQGYVLLYVEETEGLPKKVINFNIYATASNDCSTPLLKDILNPGGEKKGVKMDKIHTCKGRVLSILTLGKNLFLFTEEGKIGRYTLKTQEGFIQLKTQEGFIQLKAQEDFIQLKEDLNFNFHYRLKDKTTAVVVQDLLIFLTDNLKLYSINGKGQVVELSDRQIPTLGMYSLFKKGEENKKIPHSYALQPINFLGGQYLVMRYTLFSIENGTFSFLCGQKKHISIAGEDAEGKDDINIETRPYLTNISQDGKLFAIDQKIFYTEYKYSIDEHKRENSFTPNIWVSETKILNKIGKLDGIKVVLQDTGSKDLLEKYKKMVIGYYFILDEPTRVDKVLDKESYRFKTFQRKHHMTIPIERLNLSCESFAIALIFSSLDEAIEYKRSKIILKSVEINYSV